MPYVFQARELRRNTETWKGDTVWKCGWVTSWHRQVNPPSENMVLTLDEHQYHGVVLRDVLLSCSMSGTEYFSIVVGAGTRWTSLKDVAVLQRLDSNGQRK